MKHESTEFEKFDAVVRKGSFRLARRMETPKNNGSVSYGGGEASGSTKRRPGFLFALFGIWPRNSVFSSIRSFWYVLTVFGLF